MEQEVLTDLVMSYTEGSSYIFAFLSHINSSIMSLISPITRCIYCGHIVDLHDTMVLPVLCSSFIIANSHLKKKKNTQNLNMKLIVSETGHQSQNLTPSSNARSRHRMWKLGLHEKNSAAISEHEE